MKQRIICSLMALAFPLLANAGALPAGVPSVVLAECATSEASLTVQPSASDSLNGLLAVMQNPSPWHPANTNPADQELALTDGTGLNGLAGLLNDFPGEGIPAAVARWDLGGFADLSSLTVFSGNGGRDGRVFHHYDVFVTSASPADSGFSLLLEQVISAPFGTVNSGTWEACVTTVADASGGFIALGITGLEIHFYAVDNTGGQFRDQWDSDKPNDTDGLTAAFVSPLITEVDADFRPAVIETPTETPIETATEEPTATNTLVPPTATPTPIQCVQAANLIITCSDSIGLHGEPLHPRLRFHAGVLGSASCEPVASSTETLLVDCEIDCSMFFDVSGPGACESIVDWIAMEIGACIDDQSGGLMQWSLVTGVGLFITSEVEFHCLMCGDEFGLPCEDGLGYPIGNCPLYNVCNGEDGDENSLRLSQGLGFACVPADCPEQPTPTPTESATETPTETPTETSTPTATETETPGPCDSGYYVLDILGGRHRVGNPAIITGPIYFGNDIARDMEKAVNLEAGLDLVVLDGYGAAHFVESPASNVPQLFYFPVSDMAVDIVMTSDSQGFWVLTDDGLIYRAGSALGGGEPAELPIVNPPPIGNEVTIPAEMRDQAFVGKQGGTLRAVALVVVDENLDNFADGYIVLDSMGGRYHFANDGTDIPSGFAAAAPANSPQKLLDPDMNNGGYAWPFFPGLDIARDMELHPTQQGVVILDGWDGIHPVPVNEPTNPVFFANNRDPLNPTELITTTGMPYVVGGFDHPETPVDEGDPEVYAFDASSIFKDLEFSAGCGDGFYTLDKFGGVFVFGAAREIDSVPVPQYGNSPYFFPYQWVVDMEIFSDSERETDFETDFNGTLD